MPEAQICLLCSSFDQPIPVECLGLGSFKDEPASRRGENGSSRLLSITKPSYPVFPFTIFHRLDVKRRYTFYAERENLRRKWHEVLIDTIAVRQTACDGNKWYAPEVIDDKTFVSRAPSVPSGNTAHFTGRIIAATTFGGFAYSFYFVLFMRASRGSLKLSPASPT